MKRMLHALLAAAILVSTMTFTAFAADDGYTTNLEGIVECTDQTYGSEVYTASYDKAVPGNDYVLTVVKKVYDGSSSIDGMASNYDNPAAGAAAVAILKAILANAELAGIIGDDDVKFEVTDENVEYLYIYFTNDGLVGENIPVEVGQLHTAISGDDADKYTLIEPTGLTGKITQATPTITFSNLNQYVGSITPVTAELKPYSYDEEYRVLTPVIEYQIITPCAHAAQEPGCSHSDGCGYAENWVSAVPTTAGTYTVRAYTPGDRNLKAIPVERAVTAALSITNPHSGGGGGSSTYAIALEQPENGSISLSPKRASKGSTVTITVKPDDGYELAELTVLDKDGKQLELTEENGKYTFRMPASRITVSAEFARADGSCSCSKYTDLDTEAWYHEAVDFVIENGIMTGISDDQFAPAMGLTRGMVVQVLWAMDGKPVVNYAMSFGDVDSDAWYSEAVRWAAAEGITTGYSANVFGPGDSVTREQMALMLYGYARHKNADLSVGENTNILSYEDAFSISDWAFPGLQWACGEGILSGKTGGYLDPSGTATRMEAAQMLMKFCAVLAD